MNDSKNDFPATLKIRGNKQETKEKILNIIKKHEKIRFKELVEESGYSNKWLSDLLKEMREEYLITQEISDITIDGKIKKNQVVYKLTKEGENVLNNAWVILHKIEDLKNNKASYIHTSSNYGIENDLILSKDYNLPNNLFPNVPELNAFILKTVFKRLQNNTNLNASGKLMINFDIDVKEMISHLEEIIKFVKDLINEDPSKGEDIFKSEKLANFNWKEKIKYLFDHLKEAEFFYNDDINTLLKLRENAEELVNWYAEDIIDNYYQKNIGLVREYYERIKKYVENDENPMNDKEIAEKLVKRTELGDSVITEYLIFDYLTVLTAFNLTNDLLLEKIDKINREIRTEYGIIFPGR